MFRIRPYLGSVRARRTTRARSAGNHELAAGDGDFALVRDVVSHRKHVDFPVLEAETFEAVMFIPLGVDADLVNLARGAVLAQKVIRRDGGHADDPALAAQGFAVVAVVVDVGIVGNAAIFSAKDEIRLIGA